MILKIWRGEAIIIPDDEIHVGPVRIIIVGCDGRLNPSGTVPRSIDPALMWYGETRSEISRPGISSNASLPETKQLDETPVNPAG